MKFRRFFTRKPDDPMGALNDLAFLLIIYFLVIAGFSVNTGFLVGLPSKDKPRIVHTDDLLRLSLAAGGGLSFEGRPMSPEMLDALLSDARETHPNLTVALTVHPDAAYQRFIDVVKAVRLAGVDNFSFVMGAGG